MLNCFVKKLFGQLFMAICYFSVDLDYKPLKYLATLLMMTAESMLSKRPGNLLWLYFSFF